MFASRAFTSFTSIPNVEDHPLYNEWHQLDHRPENLAIPGVVGGERWVRSPACAELGTATEPFSRLDYFNTYWFANDSAVAEWQRLAERSFQWGRRIDTAIAERLWMGHHRPVSCYMDPRTRLSPGALVQRPNRGIVLIVTRHDEPRSATTHQWNDYVDSTYVPALVERPGVLGCWTLVGESAFAEHADLVGSEPEPLVRVSIFYLDVPVCAAAETWQPPEMTEADHLLFFGPLESISPWEWDWFAV